MGQINTPFVPSDKAICPYVCLTVRHSQILPSMMSYTHIMLTLVSVGLIDEGGYMVTFKGSTCIICDAAHTMVGCFLKREGLYQVDTNHAESVSTSLADASLSMTDAHWCLGHISPDAVRLLCKSGIITGITLHPGTEITCNSYAYAKM